MNNIAEWHKLFTETSIDNLERLLDKEVVFFSPVVFKGQSGRKLTAVYLKKAHEMFFANNNKSFQYVRELNTESDTILEFTCEIEGIVVNGVDMIKWSEHGKITEFKVMIRPFKATELVKEKMLDLLKSMNAFDKVKLKVGAVLDGLKK